MGDIGSSDAALDQQEAQLAQQSEELRKQKLELSAKRAASLRARFGGNLPLTDQTTQGPTLG